MPFTHDKVQYKPIFFVSRVYEFAETGWTPHIDIYRRGRSWLFKCDLAGVRLDDVPVSVQGSTLVMGESAGIRSRERVGSTTRW